MKLSEAIRLGSLLKPQGFGVHSGFLYASATCAFGAAECALGRRVIAYKVWPWLLKERPCPECGEEMPETTFVISNHLNDIHKWPRERIADWVATIEPEESPSVVMEETLEALQAAQ